MDGKSKILIGLFLLLVVATSVWKYKVYILDRDFIVLDEIVCDPSTEQCFVQICDNPDECEQEPYKKISINAKDLPVCDKYAGEECPVPTCATSTKDCEITYCTSNTVEEGEKCYVEPLNEEGAATTSIQEAAN